MTTDSVLRSAALVAATLLVITFAQRTARADEVFVAGSTLGCFGTGCTPQATASSSGVTFNSSTFAITTSSGFASLSSGANNLGTLTMSATPGNIGGQTFTLQITFSAPQGLTPSNQITLVYSITPFNMVGGVFFEPNPFNGQFTFSDANCENNPTSGVPGQQNTCGTGSFLVFFLDRDLSPNQTLPIGANIAAAHQEIPEPTTLLLLATGVVGLALKKRRRE